MLSQFMLWLGSLGVSEEGQGLVEYALIIVLVSIALILILGALAGGIEGVFQQIIDVFAGTGGES